MKKREEILKILRSEAPYLKQEFGLARAGLFGSWARQEQTEKSDIDILVEFERPVGFFKFLELEDYLSNILGVKVDLVTPDALKPLIENKIIQETIYA